VNRQLLRFDDRHRARATRLLSYALLILFAYGSTAEAVHSHGSGLQRVPAADTLTSAVDTASNTSSRNDTNQSGDCVICQFHQNLSAAAIFTPLLVMTAATSTPQVSFVTTSISSRTVCTRQGRAPPFSS
jgi:Protein of unknown function (DUF2946)